MRLAVIVDEFKGDYWTDITVGVLQAIDGCLDEDDHVLIRTGSVVDEQMLAAALGAGGDCDDRQAVADAIGRVPLAAFLCLGFPRSRLVDLRNALGAAPFYIGTLDLKLNPDVALRLEHSLGLSFRFVGKGLRVIHLHEALDGDAEFVAWKAEVLRNSAAFNSVSLENGGVRGSVFDEIGGPEATSRDLELERLATDSERAEALVMWLETVDHRLTESLHAAIERVKSAHSSEQAVQAALSCRRFLEMLANAVFPPQPPSPGGRDLSKAAWKNRLWAAIEERVGPTGEPVTLHRLGSKLDEIKDQSDRGVHRTPPLTREEVAAIVDDLVAFGGDFARLRGIDPNPAMDPYQSGIHRTMLELLDEGEP